MRQATVDVLQATSSHHRPTSVALAVGLGIMVGASAASPILLCAYIAAAIILPTHLFVFAIVAATSTAVTMSCGNWLGSIGYWALLQSPIASTVSWFHAFPLTAWLRLNNTVVYGSLLVGGIVSACLSSVTWVVLRAIMPAPVRQRKQVSVFEQLPSVEIPDFVLIPEEEIRQRVEEESFVELSEADMKLLSKLDPAFGKMDAVDDADAAHAVDDEYESLPAVAAELLELGKVAELDSLAKSEELVEVNASKAGEIEPASTSESAQESSSLLTHFDAAERLEELLSGCRVQPHWADSESGASVSAVDGTQDRTFEDSDDQDTDSFNSAAGTEEVLERSAEMLGLVDELMSQIEAEDLQLKPEAAATVQTGSELDQTATPSTQANLASQEVDQEASPEQGARGGELSYVDTAETPAPPPPQLARDNAAQSQSSDSDPADENATLRSPEQVHQKVQPGHDEALRYLLRHLKTKENADTTRP